MENTSSAHLTPFQRLVKLLSHERKYIGHIYFYGIVVGLISLVLPLGIQAIFGFVASGSIFSSIWVLMLLVIVGLLASGIMQIYQVSLVEMLQKRIFAKAAFEFSYRLPRMKTEALEGVNATEMMNRFFDVLTIQKSLPKFLIDITSAVLQILFGLILLSFYHSFFIAFSLVTIGILVVFVRINGKKTLETSIKESKYKYRVVAWLEDIASTLFSFKIQSQSDLPIKKMDSLVNHYIDYRNQHFRYLKGFYYYALFFKVLIIGGLLVLGTYLLMERKISLGQFVASEIVIVLLTGAVEKLFLSIDIIFDLLTAVDKLGHVTDMDLERKNGFKLSQDAEKHPFIVTLKGLNYGFRNNEKPALNNISLDIATNERLCITGQNGSGKHTLLKILGSILHDFSGQMLYKGISVRDLEIDSIRSQIAMNFPSQEVFDGTIFENLTMGRTDISFEDIQKMLETMQLVNEIATLPLGLQTQMVSNGQYFAKSFVTKIAIARCLLSKPRLFLFTDCLQDFEMNERLRLINYLTDKSQHDYTFVALTRDPALMVACERILLMNEGEITAEGDYKTLLPLLSKN